MNLGQNIIYFSKQKEKFEDWKQVSLQDNIYFM